ncbi:MAG: thioredoxin domain-containing protein [Candidatus Marinimicrobia bacterium]|jgi:hypothetical protein|nr:thioredoxin domain-containing protein [Candidatus Neomarinimicrobiota bacterium]MBT3633667.1 thioredoxin domain-containing protein [Candidatus Neomarinimicrobiota bacterium]MBT3682380.1 thioredoxin domain-containing protein [Candidatus Neomarinimicrobiota bacterium]MBT3759144.1 thioredoxin domain-containing protein [Candidatus Neomarinimicrobiota bacterium]MBT3895583.1 thioredoxin domain-containing protein [Candidatus Neomarinimicrobiota bacterium]
MFITTLFTILLFFTFGGAVDNNPHEYHYDNNGRVIIPDQVFLDQLPRDGGEYYNRLVFEQSPYLLQHAANPVDWYPWGPEAFAEAKRQDKPIFLSIGYTTCHWCHVMEHESFEDEEVAALMNDTFICIKVDREERPDVDNVYMDVTTMLNGRGGWPMTVVLTPDKEPFFAGTYFPKNSRGNRIGMMELIPNIKRGWDENRSQLVFEADSLTTRLRNSNSKFSMTNSEIVKDDILNIAFNQFRRRYDEEFGGFGESPKFPKAHDYSFLSRYWKRTQSNIAMEMVKKSLLKMRSGGMYDQIGFGFHRYSTDKEWLVPHFEKMLYDQAMLVHAYLDAYLMTNDETYANTAKEIIEYVQRDMTHPQGGFYSAEDADSEGVEAKFYVWNTDELKSILSQDDYDLIYKIFELKDSGNYREGYRHKNNILHMDKSIKSFALELGEDPVEVSEKINSIRGNLFEYRENRVHPQKDDKILTDWNGLMISAIARAARIFPNTNYDKTAISAMDFLLTTLMDKNGVLMKRYRNGSAGLPAFLEDYAYTIWALIEMYQLTFDISYVKTAQKLSDYQYLHFWDEKNGGFFVTPDNGENLLIRSKDVYDGAIPSGNSVSAYNFIRLSRILSKPQYEDIAFDIFSTFSQQINRGSSGQSMMLQAIDFANGPSYEILISGNKKSKGMIDLVNNIHQLFEPNSIIMIMDPEDEELFEYLPHLKNYPANNDQDPLVYVCENYACKLPTSDINVVKKLLEN